MRCASLYLLATALFAFGSCKAHLRSQRWVTSFKMLAGQSEGALIFAEGDDEPAHIRRRRAAYAAFGASLSCSTGWTGLYCENPICSQKNNEVSGRSTAQIESLFLDSGCAGTVVIPIDSSISNTVITFQVNVDSGRPNVTITDATGNTVSPAAVQEETGSAHVMFLSLSPGLYSVSIDNDGVPTAFCSFVAYAQTSSMALITGFVSGPNDDFPPSQESSASGQPMYFVVHTTNLAAPGVTAVVTIRDQQSRVPLYRALLQKRYGCGYEQYAGQFTCNSRTSYFYTVDGTDASGFAFRRTASFPCLALVPTPSPMVSPTPPVDVCMNGGTLLYSGLPDAQCLCGEFFTGERCEEVLCMNDGEQNPKKTGCICTDGFDGINCEKVTCTEQSGQGMLSEYKTMIVVIRATTSMAPYINGIVKAIDQVLAAFENNDIQAYHSYLLVTFANNEISFRNFFGTDPTDFRAALSALNSSTAVGFNCTDSVLAAISIVYNQIIYNKSPIYVFTDVTAADASRQLAILHMNAAPKFPIHFFLVNGTSASCSVDTLDPGVRTMNSLAQYTGGLLMAPRASRTAFVFATIARVTSYMVNNVLMNDYTHCSMKGYSTFFVDSDVKALYVLGTGVDLSLTITDPKWVQSQPMLIVSETNTFIWEIVSPTIGEYIFILQSANANAQCSYRVLAQSKYDLFYGSTSSLTIDAPYTEPVYQFSSHMVAHLNGLTNATDQFRLFAEMTISSTDEDGNVIPLYFSSGTFRKNCGYQLYFGIFSCQTPDQILYITVYADDPNGNTIQRTAVGFCSYTTPTPTPSSACQNGGVENPSNASLCICPPDFGGSHCESIICQNGGTATYGVCMCPPGTTSQFCETNTCVERSPDVGFETDGRSLAFVLNVRGSMKDSLTKIANEANDFVRDIQAASPTWINRYVIVIFNQTNVMMLLNSSDSLLFVQQLQTIAKDLAVTDPAYQGDCLTLLESAVNMAVVASQLNSYVFVFTDSAAQNEGTAYYFDTISRAENLQVEISLVSVSGAVCGAPDGRFSQRIVSLAYTTDGDIYYTTEVANMMRFIVSFYSSGIVLERESAACSTEPLNAYIPIDAWTEALTIAVTGWNPLITVTLPDGSSGLDHQTELPIINGGPGTELNIQQFIVPCDKNQWVAWQSHCYLTVTEYSGWQKASDFCRQDPGAFLVDIYSQEKQDHLLSLTSTTSYWIGLSRIGTTQEWQWEVPVGNQLSKLLPTSYSNWGTGEPSTDTSKNCVIVGYESGLPRWYAANCSTDSYSICQKHRYGQGFSPDITFENPLPYGVWRAEIKTDNGSCSAQVRVQSKIQVYYGFTTDMHSDKPLLYGNSKANNNRVIARATGLEAIRSGTTEGSLNYAYLSLKGVLSEAPTMQPRPIEECAYTSVSQDFSCPKNSNSSSSIVEFVIKFSGVDQLGNLFERTVGAYCMETTRACHNGGILVNGQCVCRAYFTGQQCDERMCMNGGVVLSDGTCNCPATYTGGSCENPVCQPKYPANFTDDGRTLAILLETSFGTTSTIYVLQKNLGDTLRAVLQGRTANWFSNFMLVPFDSRSNEQDWYPMTISNDLGTIVAALSSIPLGQCPGNKVCETGDKCPRPIISVLNRTLSSAQFSSPNSVVFIVTRSGADDYLQMEDATRLIQATHAQVNVILPDIASPCGNGFDQPAGASLYNLVAFSGGNVFLTTAKELVDAIFGLYLLSVYQSSSIDFAFARNCTYEESYIQVDRGATEISIDYNGLNPYLSLFRPDYMEMPLPESIVTSDSNYLGIIILQDDKQVGTYKLISKSDAQTCGLNVRMRSNIETFIGFTQPNDGHNGATRDDAHYAPLNNQLNIVIAHAKNIGAGRLTYVQLWSQTGILFVSELLLRAECSYEYYSSKSFSCTIPSFIVTLYGIDDQGNNFKRVFLAHCVNERPGSVQALD